MSNDQDHGRQAGSPMQTSEHPTGERVERLTIARQIPRSAASPRSHRARVQVFDLVTRETRQRPTPTLPQIRQLCRSLEPQSPGNDESGLVRTRQVGTRHSCDPCAATSLCKLSCLPSTKLSQRRICLPCPTPLLVPRRLPMPNHNHFARGSPPQSSQPPTTKLQHCCGDAVSRETRGGQATTPASASPCVHCGPRRTSCAVPSLAGADPGEGLGGADAGESLVGADLGEGHVDVGMELGLCLRADAGADGKVEHLDRRLARGRDTAGDHLARGGRDGSGRPATP